MHGGWRNKEGSRRALAEHHCTWNDLKRCKKCNQPAVATRDYCRKHGGGRFVKNPAPGTLIRRAARQALRTADREGLLVPALVTHPVWVELRFSRRWVWLPDLVQAFHSPDPSAWARTLARVGAATP